MNVKFDFQAPTEIRFGAGTFERAGELCASLGARPLIVTTRTAMERLGYTQRLTELIERQGGSPTVFKDYRTSPTTTDVDKGATRARAWAADCVLALGGGSTMDLAKAVAAAAPIAATGADLLHGRARPTAETLPILAIPTTSGSGSETNRSAIVTDAERPFKDGIRSDHLFPRYAVVDPTLTVHAGAELTAQTGFDALAHAIESYVSPRAQPIPDALALRAIGAIARHLPAAIRQPDHLEAREALAVASMSMGINLTCVGTCLPHRADKCICALHPHIAHGQSLALIYPAWAQRSLHGQPERFARVTALLDGREPSTGRAEGLPDAIRTFIARIGLDTPPSDVGLARDQVPTLVENVAGDTRIDPVPCEREELGDFFDAIITGA